MLVQYISDLLYKFDTVILPGFGAFVLQYKPAFLDTDTNLLAPPSKIVSFDPSIKNNDGILANYISEKEKISFFDACSKILTFVEDTNKKLESGNSLTMKSIGEFSKTADNTLLFTADTSINYYLEVFGMGNIAASPLGKTNVSTTPQQSDAAITIPVQKKRHFLKAAIWTLSILIILGGSGVALFILKPELIQNLKISELLNLSDKKGTSEIKITPKVQDTTEVQKPVSIPDTSAVDTTSQNNTMLDSQATQGSTESYHIISASFRIKANADNYVQTLTQKGYDSKVFFVPEKGLYMVSYNSYASEALANEALLKIQSTENANAWVLNQ